MFRSCLDSDFYFNAPKRCGDKTTLNLYKTVLFSENRRLQRNKSPNYVVKRNKWTQNDVGLQICAFWGFRLICSIDIKKLLANFDKTNERFYRCLFDVSDLNNTKLLP